jgi:adenosylcobinamide-GDP ribazoletransferase
MKDSHIGAFAAISLGLYLVLYYAFSLELEISLRSLMLISLSFILSRSASGLTVIFFPSSKNEGLFRSFKDTADKRTAAIVLFVFAVLSMSLMLFYLPLAALAMLLMLSFALLALCIISRSQFGGMSGDLAGWFLTLAELLMLIGLTTILKLMY